MPEPDQRPTDDVAKPTTPADATIPEEDAREDAETTSEAREEAERLDAVPYAREKKDEGH